VQHIIFNNESLNFVAIEQQEASIATDIVVGRPITEAEDPAAEAGTMLGQLVA
jgi:orotidine-5'-phosphate decarboxylase